MQAATQAAIKRNANPRTQSERPTRSWEPGNQQQPRNRKPGQSAQAESSQGVFPDNDRCSFPQIVGVIERWTNANCAIIHVAVGRGNVCVAMD